MIFRIAGWYLSTIHELVVGVRMNRLLEIGFEPAGHWLLKGDELVLELSRHASQRNILYAFVSDGEVKYVGKTTQSLHARMGGYKNARFRQTTNVRNNARIKALLQTGAAVDILAFPDNGLFHYGQFHMNLAAALEDSLISLIAPPWNGSATIPDSIAENCPPSVVRETSCAPTDATGEFTINSQSPKPIASFLLVVQNTYFNQGFFNVKGVDYALLFGNDGQEIEIFCGNAEQPIIGVINRTANRNQTPRIMGGTGLRDWFQRNMSPMQQATVQMLSQIAIRIQPSQVEPVATFAV